MYTWLQAMTLAELRRTLAPLHSEALSWRNLAEVSALSGVMKAAVLVALSINDDEVHVLLTKRSSNVKHFVGHVAFPGGKREATDVDEVETSFREATEEIGVLPSQLQFVCMLPPRILVQPSFLVTPVVCTIADTFTPTANAEVTAVFSIPLKRFLDSRDHRCSGYELQTGSHTIPTCTVDIHSFFDVVDSEEYNVRGMTAEICIETAVAVFGHGPAFHFSTNPVCTLSPVRVFSADKNEQFTRLLTLIQSNSKL